MIYQHLLPFSNSSVICNMKHIKLYITIIFLNIILSHKAYSQENANEGTRFLVTFPQNEEIGFFGSYVTNVKLGLYISSKYKTEVTIRNHFNNRVLTRTVTANSFIQLDKFELGNRQNLEDTDDGITSNKVIEIISARPISVNVVNSKDKSSDGYLAYPVSEWGQNYIHNSFYHHNYERSDRSSGFTIISQSDSTNIRVILKGKNVNRGTTKSGNYSIGDTIRIALNDNESYTVKTNSNTNNKFDFSGSLIVSEKPIGVISFHERTLLPQVGTKDGRDNLLEMQQPLSNWRNKFVSIDLGRKFGDFFRVLPIRDNTELKITSYDESGKLIFQKTELINTGGGFYEYNNTDINNINTTQEKGIIGNTIWEANAPILVTQYSYSQAWENSYIDNSNTDYDPFMLNLINDEQFTTNINFLAPPYNDFNNHRINLIVKVDTNKSISNQLESVVYDGSPLYLSEPTFLNNRIGNTEYFWLRFNIKSGVHSITSDVRFAAFLYGFGNADSYGMQTALGNLALVDTLIRTINSFDCSVFDVNYNIRSTFGLEIGNEFVPTDFKIQSFELSNSINMNYDFNLSLDSLNLIFKGSIINPAMPSFAIIKFISQSGKEFLDTLTFTLSNSIILRSGFNIQSIPGDTLEFKISLDKDNDTLKFLSEYTFSLKYYQEWFSLVDITVDEISRFDKTEEFNYLDTINNVLNIAVSRKSITNGNTLVVKLLPLLNKDSLVYPVFSLYSHSDDKCYTGSVMDTISYSFCIQDLRLVEFYDSNILQVNDKSLKANQDLNISVYDYRGTLLMQDIIIKKDNTLDLEIYLKAKGLYFIKINNYLEHSPLKYFHF